MLGIDLFSGAGGMSVGAEMSRISVRYAVEMDLNATATFSNNHPKTKLIARNILDVDGINDMPLPHRHEPVVLFGGPPCQGFSTSNQRNRNSSNPNNWLYKEYLRIVKETRPDWVVFENVKGLLETQNGFFLEEVLNGFQSLGYKTNHFILNAADFGVPQRRNRLFIVGSLHGTTITTPEPTVSKLVTVKEAIADLPVLVNGDTRNELAYGCNLMSPYAKKARLKLSTCWNNIVTKNSDLVIERYKHIPQGGNWENIPHTLMKNYKDSSRCHTGIYHRLNENEPSVVIGNFRKNMLIHPWQDRGLSVREAARLQSFPDNFRFYGSIGFQQQQVGNAVPPLLAKAVFDRIIEAS